MLAVYAPNVTVKECSELGKLPETGRRGRGGGGEATLYKLLAGYVCMG